VVGQADVESGETFNLIDVRVEVPDVVIAFMRLDEFLRRWELLNKEILGEEVQLERDTAGKTEQYASVPQRNKRSPIFHMVSIY
jgi:hypothetical protein